MTVELDSQEAVEEAISIPRFPYLDLPIWDKSKQSVAIRLKLPQALVPILELELEENLNLTEPYRRQNLRITQRVEVKLESQEHRMDLLEV